MGFLSDWLRERRQAALLRKRFGALKISDQRVNDAIREERRQLLSGDVVYRNKVKRRMLEGLTAEQLPPLYVGKKEPTTPTHVVKFARGGRP